jgi:AmmeMemoRadiSam system protein A
MGEELKAAATISGMESIALDIKEKAPDTIIIITPHGPLFSDANSIAVEESLKGDFGQFGHRELSYKFHNDLDLSYQIVKNSLKDGINLAQMTKEMYKSYGIADKLDHGVLVPLHFVDRLYSQFDVVPITYGLLSSKELYKFGRLINEAIKLQKGDVSIIASGDLSHKLLDSGPYSYVKEGPEFDKELVNILRDGKLSKIVTFDLALAQKAGECGLKSLIILAGILSDYKIETDVLSYEGPFGVGYATAIFNILGEEAKDYIEDIEIDQKNKLDKIKNMESSYVKLARNSLTHFLEYKEYLEIPEDIDRELLDIKKPVFVTLKKNGALRGCIGSTSSREENLAMEIIKYAVEAGLNDPRFPEVELNELAEITFSVDVLEKPEPIDSIDSLDTQEFGVIVTKGYKKGLLLPRIEGVDTKEEQVRIALNKAGIGENEDYKMERFRVTRHY